MDVQTALQVEAWGLFLATWFVPVVVVVIAVKVIWNFFGD